MTAEPWLGLGFLPFRPSPLFSPATELAREGTCRTTPDCEIRGWVEIVEGGPSIIPASVVVLISGINVINTESITNMMRWLLHSAEDKGSRMSFIVCSLARGWAPNTSGESHPDDRSSGLVVEARKIWDKVSTYQG